MADIIGRVRIDGSSVQPGLNQATAGINRWVGQVKGTIAGIFSGAAFVSAIRKTIADIDQISDVSEEFDVPVEQIQALKIAAMEASDEFTKLHAILTKLQDVQIDIVKGDSAAALKNRQILERHGITPEAINQMSVTKFATIIADKITNAAELNQLLGPRMAGKFNVYRGALSNLDEDVARGTRSGRIKTKEEIDDLNRIVSEGKAAWGNLWNTIMSRLFAIGFLVNKLVDIFKWFNEELPLLPKSVRKAFSNVLGLGDPVTMSNWIRGLEEKFRKQLEGIGFLKPKRTAASTEHQPLFSQVGGSVPLHSDALLSVGNFLGQGFQNIGVVTSLVEETKKQTPILEKIEMNTRPTPKETAWQRTLRGFGGSGGWNP